MPDDKLNWAGASIGFSEADLRGEDENAGGSVAAELTDLLPRLPRVKITPQTITQTIIDHWYGYETEYRQTIAELRAELAEALDALTVAAELIDRLAFDDECDYDHHACCQAHNLHEHPCPHPLGRQFVEAWRAVEAEQKEAAGDA